MPNLRRYFSSTQVMDHAFRICLQGLVYWQHVIFHGHKVITIDLKCCEPQIVRNKFYLLLRVPCRLLHLSFKWLLLCFLCKHLLMGWAWRLQAQSFPWSWLMVDIGSSKPLGMQISNSSFFAWSHPVHLLVFTLCQITLFCFCSGHEPLEGPAGPNQPLTPTLCPPSVRKVAQPSWAPHQDIQNLSKYIH